MGDVFIIGAPRSGTSWLRTLLASHPDLASPFELHLFSRYLAPLDRAFFDEERERLRRTAAGLNSATGLASLLTRPDFDEWLGALHRRARATALAGKPGATRLLEKTPGHALHVELIRRLAPGARFVHLVRDPRDVVASLRAKSERPFGEWAPRDVPRATASWRRHVRAALRDALPDDTLRVRYEDLRADPELELGRLAAWLELAGPVSSWLVGDPTARAHERAHALTIGRAGLQAPPSAGSAEYALRVEIGRPTDRALSPSGCYFVESRCAPEMAELGYAPRVYRAGRIQPFRAAAALATASWSRFQRRRRRA